MATEIWRWQFDVKHCKQWYSDLKRKFKKQETIARKASGLGTRGEVDEDGTRNLEEELVYQTMHLEDTLKRNRVDSADSKTREGNLARGQRDFSRKHMDAERQLLKDIPPNCLQEASWPRGAGSGDITGAPSVTQKKVGKGSRPQHPARSDLGGSTGVCNLPAASGGMLDSVLFDSVGDEGSARCSVDGSDPGGAGCASEEEKDCITESGITRVAREGASHKSKRRRSDKGKARGEGTMSAEARRMMKRMKDAPTNSEKWKQDTTENLGEVPAAFESQGRLLNNLEKRLEYVVELVTVLLTSGFKPVSLGSTSAALEPG